MKTSMSVYSWSRLCYSFGVHLLPFSPSLVRGFSPWTPGDFSNKPVIGTIAVLPENCQITWRRRPLSPYCALNPSHSTRVPWNTCSTLTLTRFIRFSHIADRICRRRWGYCAPQQGTVLEGEHNKAVYTRSDPAEILKNQSVAVDCVPPDSGKIVSALAEDLLDRKSVV